MIELTIKTERSGRSGMGPKIECGADSKNQIGNFLLVCRALLVFLLTFAGKIFRRPKLTFLNLGASSDDR